MKSAKYFIMVTLLILCTAVVILGHATVYAGDMLSPGEELKRGDDLKSANREYRLILQRDGNLVLYGPRKRPLWSTNTQGSPVEKCIMQRDGNLVLYLHNGQPIWDSKTFGKPGSFLVLQNDGNLVIYHPQPVWASNTSRRQWEEGPDRRGERHDREDHDRGGDRRRD
jgi:hypothetical protein